jgi:hypothetical protein
MAEEIAHGPHFGSGAEIEATTVVLLLLVVVGLVVLLLDLFFGGIGAKPIALAETLDLDFPATQISLLHRGRAQFNLPVSIATGPSGQPTDGGAYSPDRMRTHSWGSGSC